jgi:cytoskeletal protein RodZ
VKNFFAFLGVVVVLFVVLGIWQGWFKFAVNSDEKVTVEVDGKKVKADGEKASEVVKEKLEDLKKKQDDETPTTDKTTPTGKTTPTTGKKLVETPGPLFGGR